MKKYLVIGFLVVIAALTAYLTFIISVIKLTVGAILLGIAAIAFLVVWILWKVKED